LTQSWRFGPAITLVANLVLFAKEYSKQTGKTFDHRLMKKKDKNWIPYRVKAGVPSMMGKVTTSSILPECRTRKVTLISFANLTLMNEMINLMGFFGTQRNRDPEGNSLELLDFPKVHVVGGTASGSNWKSMKKLVGEVFDLYSITPKAKQLPKSMFPDFQNRGTNWPTFLEECEEKDLRRYCLTIQCVLKYQQRTLEAMEFFKKHVLDKDVPVEQADIILTTCHKAKGLEWANVQLCDDFIALNQYEKKKAGKGSIKGSPDGPWQFAMGFGDRVNLLYVACTRPKKLLSLPLSMQNMLGDSDLVFRHVIEKQTNGLKLSGSNMALRGSDVAAFYRVIVARLRKEVGVKRNESLVQTIIQREGGENSQLLTAGIEASCHSENRSFLSDLVHTLVTPGKSLSNDTKRVADGNDTNPSIIDTDTKDDRKPKARRNLFGDRDDASKKQRKL
jgi:hypothetical protein